MLALRHWLGLTMMALPANAQLAVGTDAPTIEFSDALNAPPGMRELADLRGAAIVVEQTSANGTLSASIQVPPTMAPGLVVTLQGAVLATGSVDLTASTPAVLHVR